MGKIDLTINKTGLQHNIEKAKENNVIIPTIAQMQHPETIPEKIQEKLKNIGPGGVVIAVIREDLITEDVLPGTPTMLRYKTHADNGSMYNTPPAYGIYICGKVFQWLLSMGGLEAIRERNVAKAKVLYDFLDASRLFHGTVVKKDRSLMNVPFVTGDAELDAKFVKAAEAAGFVSLKGHRTVGGMRASIYNAMPMEGVVKLVQFMERFEKENR